MDQSSTIKTYSQSQRLEDCDLWELAFEYPPLYEAIESAWLQSPEFTDQDILNSVTIAYQKAEQPPIITAVRTIKYLIAFLPLLIT